MINNNIVNIVEDLKHYTKESLDRVQHALVPTFMDLGMGLEDYTYFYNGEEMYVDLSKQIVLEVASMPFRSLHKRKGALIFTEKMEKMIDDLELNPFLLFINKKFIPWSEITIISNFNKNYISIDRPLLETIETIDTLYLPFGVTYSESGVVNGEEIFSFDEEGLNNPVGTYKFSIQNDNIFYEEYTSSMGLKNVEVELDQDRAKLTRSNILLFRNGKLYTDYELRLDGLNIFTINNGEFEEGEEYVAKIIYNRRGNKSVDNIYNIDNLEYVKNILKSRYYGGEVPEYLDELMMEFDYNFDKEAIDNNDLIQLSLAYIMMYNFELLNRFYTDNSNILSVTYTGKEINLLATDVSAVRLPRRHGFNPHSHDSFDIDPDMQLQREYTDFDNYVMVFVNGELYNHYMDMTYKNNYFTLPIIGINDDDVVEFLFIRGVDNRILDAKIMEGEFYTVIDPSIDLDKLQIFVKEVPTDYLDYFIQSRDDRIHYEVPFYIEPGNQLGIEHPDVPRIRYYDDWFYGKRVAYASKAQFRYVGYNILREDIAVMLSPDFNYCHNINQYMVFKNGRRVDHSHFKITVPDMGLPIDDISVYLKLPLYPGDRLDIFYLPCELTEIDLQPEIPITGDIIIDKTKLSYNLNKDLYMVFVNGRKINSKDMKNISSTRLQITSNLESAKNLTILKHIPDEKDLQSLFTSNNSLFDNIVAKFSEEELATLFNLVGIDINDVEEDIYKDEIDTKSVLYEIVRDYWLRTGAATTGSPFVYHEYNTEIVEEQDDGDNDILPVRDANREENVIMEWQEDSLGTSN